MRNGTTYRESQASIRRISFGRMLIASWRWGPAHRRGRAGRAARRAIEQIDERNGERSEGVSIEWDAGDLGCGDLVLELCLRLEAMQPGQLLRLTARDPGARADIPAWCRMTGHALIAQQHPVYQIRRKEN